MLRRLIKASAIVIGVGLVVAACPPVKMGAAAIVGNERITIATLGTQVTNLSQAAKQYPGVVKLSAVAGDAGHPDLADPVPDQRGAGPPGRNHGLDRPGARRRWRRSTRRR